MQTCPHCNQEIRIRELPHPGFFANYRICPGCGGSFTVDPATKRRQAMLIVLLMVVLILTLLLYFDGTLWLIPAIVSYIILGLLLYWGNKKLFFVPYTEDGKSGSRNP